jgi:RNA polymerase sigma-70 factor (ECF subfamily)
MAADDRTNQERLLRAAILRGEEHAWRLWYDASSADLRAYTVWRCGGRRDVADEIVQEVWLIAVRRIRQFEPDRGPFAAWLRGIAANVLKNHRRKKVPRAGSKLKDLSEPALSAAAHDTLDRRDDADRIAEALSALPDRYEEVLRAKYLDQLSMAEIARGWNESTKTIESLLTRARVAFRECYRDAGENSPGPVAVADVRQEHLK